MIVPSIDLLGGRAVQLVGGDPERVAVDGGDPRPLMERFRLAGEVAVIDLDAALGRGSNAELIGELVAMGPCRVGGGLRDADAARRWLDRGAARVILGTAARPEVLGELPRDRVVAALDASGGEVVVEGWQTRTGTTVVDRMRELRGHVGGFMVTFVDVEGRLGGTEMEAAERLAHEAGDADLTIAGGIATAEEIRQLHDLGADAQVGMALYERRLHLADGLAAPLRSDRPDGLWPTVVCDRRGTALGLAYTSAESLRAAVDRGAGVYQSRSRGLWQKGASSGATQRLLRVDPDCDADALRFVVEQAGLGFCHRGTWSCWGDDGGVSGLVRTLRQRLADAPAGSYTRKLLDEPERLRKKLLEEAGELAEAETPDEVTWETADVLYFALVAMVRGGVDLADVEAELDRRARKVTRRTPKPDEEAS